MCDPRRGAAIRELTSEGLAVEMHQQRQKPVPVWEGTAHFLCTPRELMRGLWTETPHLTVLPTREDWTPNCDAPNPSPCPNPPGGPEAAHLAAATGAVAVLLLLGVLTCTVLFSATWAVIHAGSTLFLCSDFKSSISLVSHKEEPGPKLNDFRTANPTLSSHQELQVCLS